MTFDSRRRLVAAVAAFVMLGRPVLAQWQANTGPTGVASGVVVGSEVERYVKALSVAGIVRDLPWTIRGYGRADLRAMLRDTVQHPWAAALDAPLRRHAAASAVAFTSVNSGFVWGANDGAMWQGRGANASLGLAASVSWGPLEAIAAPVAFWAQNASVPLLPQPLAATFPYADGLFPTAIDLPQRMGDRAYTRVTPGESRVRVHGGGLQVGISAASEGWGTGETFPAILGPNAGGFPHLFVGTDGRGLRIPYLGIVSTRYILGTLSQTPWSSVQGSETYLNTDQPGTRRLGTGLTASFMPAVLPGLEVGASRFYHSPWRDASRRWDAWSKPFEGIFKRSLRNTITGPNDPDGDIDNQLASFFARWVFPRRGVEVSFELLREDHNWDSRDLAQEPENNSATAGAVRAITHRAADRLELLTLEYFDGDVRPIAQARAQGFLYESAGMRQGHTEHGQLLGAPLGPGAIHGARVAWERFTPSGSRRFMLQRWRTRSFLSPDPEQLYRPPGFRVPNSHDWVIDGSAMLSQRYRGRGTWSIEGGIAWAGRWNLDAARTNVYLRSSASLF